MTTGRSCGDWLRPCKQWLPKPRTQPNGRWWRQPYYRQWRGCVLGRWRVSKSEDLMDSEARYGMRRSPVEHTLEEWDPGHSARSGSYIGGQSANWAAPCTTPSSPGRASWKESWRNCLQGQSGKMSASMDGADSAQRHCTRREPPCPASSHGADRDPPKRPVDALNVWKKALSDLSRTSREPQIPIAKTYWPRSLPDSRSTMYGQKACSPKTF